MWSNKEYEYDSKIEHEPKYENNHIRRQQKRGQTKLKILKWRCPLNYRWPKSKDNCKSEGKQMKMSQKQQDKPKSEEKYKNVDNTLDIITVILTNVEQNVEQNITNVEQNNLKVTTEANLKVVNFLTNHFM